jgi:uncharacterized protein (TIGR02246 family)
MNREPPSKLSRALAVALMVFTVPLALWLIPEPEPPKATDAPLLPPLQVATPLTLDPHPEEAIRGAVDTYYAAVNAGDAGRMATLWAVMDDVVMDLPDNTSVRGRPAVDAAYRKMLVAGGKQRVEPSRVRIRVLGGRAEVALLETVTPLDGKGGGPRVHVATHVLFKTDAGWRWVAYRRLPEQEPLLAPDGGG